MRLQRTYYEVMGLPRSATPQEIKTKYHELARQFHPDRAQDKVLAERLFVQINLAYRTLMDRDKRSVYDSSLQQADSASAPRRAAGTPTSPAPTQAATPTTTARPTTPPPSQQQPRPAQPTATQSVKINVTESLQRANVALMAGDRITAHKLCMDVLRVEPQNSEARQLVGDIYAEQGRRQEALAEYRAAAAAGGSILLQEKIKRMETAVTQSGKPSTSTSSAGSARPPTPPSGESEKKGSILDRLIGRSR